MSEPVTPGRACRFREPSPVLKILPPPLLGKNRAAADRYRRIPKLMPPSHEDTSIVVDTGPAEAWMGSTHR